MSRVEVDLAKGVVMARGDQGTMDGIHASRERFDESDGVTAISSNEAPARISTALLARWAHDLRNDIAPLSNVAQILALTPGLPPQIRQLGTLLERQSARLSRSVDESLDGMRLLLGQCQLDRRQIDLASWSRELCQALNCDATGAKVAATIPNHPVNVDVDAAKLRMVLTSLMRAIARARTAAGTIDFQISVDGMRSVMTISTPRQGLSLDSQGTASIHAVDDATSWMAGQIIILHGGELEVLSEGRGVCIRLPVVSGHDVVTKPPAEPDEAREPVGMAERLRKSILLVEDTRVAAQLMVRLLENLGHEARAVDRVMDAMVILETSRPDLVISDLGLAGLDGFALARMVHERLPTDRPVLVALTGSTDAETRTRAMAAGFDDFVVKPMSRERLEELSNRWLR